MKRKTKLASPSTHSISLRWSQYLHFGPTKPRIGRNNINYPMARSRSGVHGICTMHIRSVHFSSPRFSKVSMAMAMTPSPHVSVTLESRTLRTLRNFNHCLLLRIFQGWRTCSHVRRPRSRISTARSLPQASLPRTPGGAAVRNSSTPVGLRRQAFRLLNVNAYSRTPCRRRQNVSKARKRGTVHRLYGVPNTL